MVVQEDPVVDYSAAFGLGGKAMQGVPVGGEVVMEAPEILLEAGLGMAVQTERLEVGKESWAVVKVAVAGEAAVG